MSKILCKESTLLASLARDSFFDFLREFWSVVVHEPVILNWHIEYVCNELQEVAERVFSGELKAYDLVINVPPGSTKSTVCSQMFPAWVWTRMPHAQFICVSYAERIAFKDALRMRDIVQSDLYRKCFPGLELRADLNTKGLFKNLLKGYRLSSGLGGQVMGEHGHFLIVDDPLDPEQSYSTAELVSVNRFMETTLPSRKIDKLVTPIILIQQRLHQADPSGEMLDKSRGKKVRHICLPGELTDSVSPPELRSKYVEGLLDPIRSPRFVLDQMKKDLGAYGYAAQVLQDPVPLGGGLFQTMKLVLEKNYPPGISRLVRSWDKAGTEDGGAYSSGTLMGLDRKGRYWVLDQIRGQWGSTKREEVILQTAHMDGDDVEILLEIEGGSGGKESGENTVRNLAGFRVLAYHPTGDKESRAYPFSSQVGGGNVSVLIKEWTREYVEELRFFPNGKYKDQVDSSSSAFNRLAKRPMKIGGW